MTTSQFVEKIEEVLPNEPAWRILAIAQVVIKAWEKGTISSIDKTTISQAVNRLQSMDEQHAAVSQELDQLASSTPQEFQPSHIWILIRAIKTQSQILDLVYSGDQAGVVRSN